MDSLTFELVSPERLLLSQAVEMVVVPGSEGQFGVLLGHAPVIAALKPGVIDVHDGGRVSRRIFVGGGFAEVTPDRCVVLAEVAVPMEDMDRAQVVARIEALEASQPGSDQPGPEQEISPSELYLTRAMLAAIDNKPF